MLECKLLRRHIFSKCCLQKIESEKSRGETKKRGRGKSQTCVSLIVSLETEYNITWFIRPRVSSALFFSYNNQLGPPYHILVDTNFVNFSIQNKLDIVQSMMDCLYAKCGFGYYCLLVVKSLFLF